MSTSFSCSSVDESNFFDILSSVERLHRRLLDLIKDELARLDVKDLSGTQALMLFNIFGKVITAGELITKGYYLGTNVSYNLKKLVSSGYVLTRDSPVDGRTVNITLTAKGERIAHVIWYLYQNNFHEIKGNGVSGDIIEATRLLVYKLEMVWNNKFGIHMHRVLEAPKK